MCVCVISQDVHSDGNSSHTCYDFKNSVLLSTVRQYLVGEIYFAHTSVCGQQLNVTFDSLYHYYVGHCVLSGIFDKHDV